MCRKTGRRLEGWDHIAQSLDVLFKTRVKTRIERRAVGSAAPGLQDMPANPETVLDQYVAIAEAIDAFEPRVELQGFQLIRADETGEAMIAVSLVEKGSSELRTVEVTG